MYYARNPYTSRVLAIVALDFVTVFLVFAAAWVTRDTGLEGGEYAAMASLAIAGLLTTLFFTGAYSPETIGRRDHTLVAALASMGIGLVAAAFLYFFVPVPSGVVSTLAFVGGVFLPVFMIERAVARSVLRSAPFRTRVLILGISEIGLEIADALMKKRDLGISPIGFLSDEMDLYCEAGEQEVNGYPVLGRMHELEKVLDKRDVGLVLAASKSRNEEFPAEQMLRLKMHGCRIESAVKFYERLTGRVYLRDLRSNYFIFAQKGFRENRYQAVVRRIVDLTAASIGLVLAAPLIAICGAIVKLESEGPAFFRQERAGRYGKPFTMVKLRSMRKDAESSCGAVFAAEKDTRITRFGRFMRRTRLDELPQLWNVLRGDMSLVGPRAERGEFGDELVDRYRFFHLRTAVKPGITGWAQTRFGYVNDFEAYEQKISLDLYYVLNRSLVMDALILVNTIKTVVQFRGM